MKTAGNTVTEIVPSRHRIAWCVREIGMQFSTGVTLVGIDSLKIARRTRGKVGMGDRFAD